MITSLDQLDFDKTYSYADYLTWKFDEFVELIKGKIFPMSAPNRLHQELSLRLSGLFFNYLRENERSCKVYAAPFDVRLLKNPSLTSQQLEGMTDKEIYTVVQPDLSIICDLEKLDDKGCKGSPNLIIEILSNNAKRDVKDKFELYEENGVQEYWIVRPNEKTIQQFFLEEEKYVYQKTFVENEYITSIYLPDLTIDLEIIFAD
ncbi:Uma2 family endonuclease [Bernardetia sp.]|uniref:Uma2 family endonuclease n=1 Tax=Bernardetia sp. TaxID=1937974 RepID=UPI0025C4D1C8|nr:Uma2 family endonuclease [Bernardetia sp.]